MSSHTPEESELFKLQLLDNKIANRVLLNSALLKKMLCRIYVMTNCPDLVHY